MTGHPSPIHEPLEASVVIAIPYVVGALLGSLLLLLVPQSWSRFGVFVVHLAALVALGLILAVRLAPSVSWDWFVATSWTGPTRRLAGGIALVVVVTGVVALATLVSSAALRFQPSLQFLQLLSALDIAWAGAALVLGLWRWRGRSAAVLGGVTLGVVCVASIWNYLRVVGLAADGGWLLDGRQLLRLVLPADMVAAVVAGVVLWVGMRRETPTSTAVRRTSQV